VKNAEATHVQRGKKESRPQDAVAGGEDIFNIGEKRVARDSKDGKS
jgi:hypothetical protein